MRIGVISDTHLPSLIRQLDDLGPQAAQFVTAVQEFLRAERAKKDTEGGTPPADGGGDAPR